MGRVQTICLREPGRANWEIAFPFFCERLTHSTQ
jgi:hypothetical protein